MSQISPFTPSVAHTTFDDPATISREVTPETVAGAFPLNHQSMVRLVLVYLRTPAPLPNRFAILGIR